MVDVVDVVLEDDRAELAGVARSGSSASAARRTSFSLRSRYWIRSAIVTILRPCVARELHQVGQARHRAVVVHDLADHAGGRQAREPRQVDGALGLAGAPQHAALARAQREDVAGARRGRAGCASSAIATRIVCARSAAEMPVVTPWRASIETVKAVPKAEVFSQSGTIIGRRSSLEPLLGRAAGRSARARTWP